MPHQMRSEGLEVFMRAPEFEFFPSRRLIDGISLNADAGMFVFRRCVGMARGEDRADDAQIRERSRQSFEIHLCPAEAVGRIPSGRVQNGEPAHR